MKRSGMSRTNEGRRKLEADLEAIENKLHDELIMRVRHDTGLLYQSASVTAELAAKLAEDNY